VTDETGTGALVFAGGNIGAATGDSLALNGATLGTHKLSVSGTISVGNITFGANAHRLVDNGAGIYIESGAGSGILAQFDGSSGGVSYVKGGLLKIGGTSSGAPYCTIDTATSVGTVTFLQTDGVTKSDFVAAAMTASSITIGGGSAISKVLTATAALDFGSINDGASAELDITLTGTTASSTPIVSTPASLNSGLIASAIAGTDKITVRLTNCSGGAIDAGSLTFRGTAFNH